MPRDLDLTFDISTGALTLDRVVGNYVKRSETLTLSVTIVSNGASATIPSGLVGTLKPVNTYGTTLAQWTTFSQVGATNVYTASTTINAAAVTTLLGTTTEQANCVFDFAGAGVVESDTLALVLKNNVTRDTDTAPTALLERNDFLVTNGTGLLVNVAAGYAANGAFVAAQASLAITNATNYIEVTAAGVASVNTTAFTAGSYPLATVVASAGAITSNTDLRAWITPKPSTSTGLTVGTSAITGGTTGRILYDNAGVLGEYAITGTGSVMLNTRPSLSENVPGARPNEFTIGSALVPTRIFSMEPTDETNYTALIISQNARRNDTDSGWIRDVADLPMMRTAFEYNYETEGRRQHEFNMDVAPNGAAGTATFPLRMFQGTYITSGPGVGTGAFDFNVILRAGAGFEAGGGVLFTSTSTFNQAATFAGGIHATKIQLGATAGAAIGIDIVPLNSATQPTAGRSWMRVGGGSSEYLMINAGLAGGYVDFCQDLGSGVRVWDGTGGHVTYLTAPATGTLRVTTNGSTLGTVDAATFTGNAATASAVAFANVTGSATDNLNLAAALSAKVAGPATATDGNAPIFSGATGKIIADAGAPAVLTNQLGTNVATFLATPSSANLRAALTDETGTGAAYFAGGDAGTPSALVGTNITSLNASNVSSGTLADARLSANVPLKDAANTFTLTQSMTSPAITTSITTPSTTFALVNATATTVNIGGAATTIAMGAAGAGTMNIPLTTSASSATTGALTIGNGTAATNVGIGGGKVNIGGTLAVGGIATFSANPVVSHGSSPGFTCTDGSRSNAFSIYTGTTYLALQSGAAALSATGSSTMLGINTGSAVPIVFATDNWVERARIAPTTGNFTIASTTDSTTKDTGCLVVEGGIGVEKAVVIGTTLAVTGATTLTGNLTSNGARISTPQALSGNGAVAAVNLTTEITTIANTGTANTTTTLAAGTNGQKKVISFITDGGFDAVITVTNPAWGGAGTITMNDALDNIELRYLNSVWQVFINNGCTLA